MPFAYQNLLQLALPELILVLVALGILGWDVLRLSDQPTERRWRLLVGFGVLGCVVAGASLWLLPERGVVAGGMWVTDPLVRWLKAVLLGLSAGVLVLSLDETFTRHVGEYVALVLLATVGMLFMVGSEDLLMLFVALELASLSLYVLTALNKPSLASAEAALKYFLFGGMAAAFLLYGFSFLYGMTGQTQWRGMAPLLAAKRLDPLLWVALGMVGIGLGFKVAVVPFHLWAPDAYVGAPTPAAALVASGSKVASFFVLVKLLRVALPGAEGSVSWGQTTPGWAPLIGGMVVLSVLVGNLAAILQSNVKRLLAYSAIAHAGYALLGVLAQGEAGLTSLIYYTVTYAVTALGAFGVVQWVERKAGGCELEHFAGLSRRSPVLAFCMFIFMLSLAGIPPLAGFFGKFYVFAAAAQVGGQAGLLWLVAVAIAGSAISFYYYLRVLKQMYVSAPPTDDRWVVELGPLGVIVLSAVVVVVAGCRPDWVIGSLRIAVEAASVR